MSVDTAAQIAIHWLSAPTSLLSFWCSAAICFHVISHRQRQAYHRLILGLSIFDMVSSGTIFAARFGNITTPGLRCSAVAFLQMWSVASATWYNVCLSFMFLMIVNYNVKDENIVKYLERPAHLVSSLSPAAICIAGQFLEVWNPVTFCAVCWVGKYPTNCEGDECIRGGEWFFFYDHFVHALFYLGVFLMIVANALIFWHVHRTVTRNRRYSQPLERQRRRSSSNKDNRARTVAKRSFLFCGGFFFTYIFSITQSKLESESAYGTWWYVTISILSSIFWPLQGFFDSLIFFHPRYAKWRRANPERSRWFAFYMTIFTIQAPVERRFHSRRVTSHSLSAHSFLRRPTFRRSSLSIPHGVSLEMGNGNDDDDLQQNEKSAPSILQIVEQSGDLPAVLVSKTDEDDDDDGHTHEEQCKVSSLTHPGKLWAEGEADLFPRSEEVGQSDDDIAVFG